jgi:hypothetical protein
MKDLKHIRRFNESEENLNISDVRSSKINESKNTDIKVKDIIIFLQQFDPETSVFLDHDGWQNYGDDNIEKNDVIRYVFDDSSITHRGGNSITINN